jgi:hypothetical protein
MLRIAPGGEDVPVIRDLDKKVINRRFSGVTGDFFKNLHMLITNIITQHKFSVIHTIKIAYL